MSCATCSSRCAAPGRVPGPTPSPPLSKRLSRKAPGRRFSTRNGYKGHVPRGSSAVCPYPLVILLLLDLFHLVEQLAGPELQLCQLVLGSNLRVVVGMLPDLDIQVHTLEGHGVGAPKPQGQQLSGLQCLSGGASHCLLRTMAPTPVPGCGTKATSPRLRLWHDGHKVSEMTTWINQNFGTK